MSMLQYKNVWGGGNDPVPSIRNDFEYAKCPNAYCKTIPLRLNALDVGQMPDAVRLESRSVLAFPLIQPVPPSDFFLEADWTTLLFLCSTASSFS